VQGNRGVVGQSRGKAQGQIDKLIKELESNNRLSSVFTICEKLCIDDPIHWMNNTKPIVVDWWIAHHSLSNQREKDAYDRAGKKSSQEVSPTSALQQLNNKMS